MTEPTRSAPETRSESIFSRRKSEDGSPGVSSVTPRAVRRSLVPGVLLAILGALSGFGLSLATEPVYEAQATFFLAVETDPETTTALQAEEFAQRRITSYVGVVTSEQVARTVIAATDLDLTPGELTGMIEASTDPETVLLNVRVLDTSRERTMLIARSLTMNLNAAVAGIDSGGSGDDVSLNVISGPTLTPYPVSPRTKLNVAIGTVLGLALGVAIGLLHHQTRRRGRDADELAEETGLPTLGTTYHSRATRHSPADSDRRNAESFKRLRTNLQVLEQLDGPSVLLVAASTEGEGATTTATNLARAMADAGRRVILVDADVRRPHVARYLRLPNDVGLTTLARGDDVQLGDVTQQLGDGGLSVLTSGPRVNDPAELLGSGFMRKLVQDLRNTYDVVVLDAPALLPVTDGATLAPHADGLLLVVRWDKVTDGQVAQALAILERVQARVLGTVLSMSRHDPLGRSSYFKPRA